MIDNFEEYTAHLTPYEKDMMVPLLVEDLKKRVGRKYAIRNKALCKFYTEKGYQGMKEARIRKCINYILMMGFGAPPYCQFTGLLLRHKRGGSGEVHRVP